MGHHWFVSQFDSWCGEKATLTSSTPPKLTLQQYWKFLRSW